MNRILTSIMALAFCASLGSVAMASKMNNEGLHKGTTMRMHGCKKGQMWVKPYMRKGKMVSGYCRAK